MRAIGGVQGWKSIEMRLFSPNGDSQRKKFTAPAKQCFTETDIEKSLELTAETLEKNHPLWEFRVVQIAPNKFNFIYAGLREAALVSADV